MFVQSTASVVPHCLRYKVQYFWRHSYSICHLVLADPESESCPNMWRLTLRVSACLLRLQHLLTNALQLHYLLLITWCQCVRKSPLKYIHGWRQDTLAVSKNNRNRELILNFFLTRFFFYIRALFRPVDLKQWHVTCELDAADLPTSCTVYILVWSACINGLLFPC